MIRVKRIYEEPSPGDGERILVDRLWPRGTSKEKARLDAWLKEIAPSDGLRKWYGHDPARWEEFKSRYALELVGKEDMLEAVLKKARQGTVTLLFSAKEVNYNNAAALKEILERKDKEVPA